MSSDPQAVAVSSASVPTYFEWSPVMAGSAIAVAISAVLSQFGASVGLGLGDTMVSENQASWNVIVASLWLVLTALSATAAGAYVAGRMRMPMAGSLPQEREFRDGAHGIAVWAVSTIAVTAAGALMAALAAIAAGLGADAANVAQNDIPDNVARFARNGATIFAFGTAVAAALSAGAGWFAAEFGGAHRDEAIDVHRMVPGMLRKR